MIFSFFQLLAWFCLSVVIATALKSKVRYVFCFFSSLFCCLEVFSVYATGELIGYQFYNHLELSVVKAHAFQFLPFLPIVIFAFLVVFLSMCYLGARLTAFKNKGLNFGFGVISLAVLFMPDGVVMEASEVYLTLNADSKEFSEALRGVGVSPDVYTSMEELEAVKGKNVIVISLESLEYGFLFGGYKSSVPKLKGLSETWTFFDNMRPAPGSTWTAGSLYSHQVGVPAYFKGQSNSIFQAADEARLIGLGDVLSKAGYDSKYLVANKGFAGMSDLLAVYGIDAVDEKNSIGEYSEFYDLDLFSEAKLQIKRFKEADGKPFALFMSTLNTHFPKGIYDQRMESFVTAKESLDFTVSSLDYLISDFLSFLEREGALDDTAIFIFPDHLFMGNNTEILSRLSVPERKLYLITNIQKERFGRSVDETIYHLDVPRLIVEGAEINTNANFMSDFWPRDNLVGFIKDKQVDITTLNTSSLQKLSYLGGVKVSAHRGGLLLKTGAREFEVTLRATADDNHYYEYSFDSEMRLLAIKSISKNEMLVDGSSTGTERFYLNVHLDSARKSRVYFGDKRSVGMFKEGNVVSITAEQIKEVLDSSSRTVLYEEGVESVEDEGQALNAKAVLSGKELEFAADSKPSSDIYKLIAHAGGEVHSDGEVKGRIYTNSFEALEENYQKGFRLFELDIIKTSDGKFVAGHSWESWRNNTDYNGDIPVDEATFLKYKFISRFTPLNMDRMNQWFLEHPDAILVTDKVNSPAEFSKAFIDKNRLMMELFTWESVKEGVSLNIKSAMPSGYLLEKIKGDKVSYLKGLGVTAVPMSRRLNEKQMKIASDIMEAGIKVYAFHVNFDKGKTERYVFCNESEFFYGVYADRWDFEIPLDCKG